MAKDYFSDVLVEKRDGRKVPFDASLIKNAVLKAADCTLPEETDREILVQLASNTTRRVKRLLKDTKKLEFHVEEIQDVVENALMEQSRQDVAKAYILYRDQRTKSREIQGSLMQALEEIIFMPSIDSDLARENANINADAPMGAALKIASEASKKFYLDKVVNPEHARAHKEGYIHIHDLDFYGLTTTCTQIDLEPLFKFGFTTGHGSERPPSSIGTAAALTCIVVQANQNDQHRSCAFV